MKIGDILLGTVVTIKPYGIFVEFPDSKTGLIHISELKSGFIDNIYDIVSMGEEVRVQVIDLDEYSQKVSLSMRTLEKTKNQSHTHHRFSSSRFKSGFQPLADALPRWTNESMEFLREKK